MASRSCSNGRASAAGGAFGGRRGKGRTRCSPHFLIFQGDEYGLDDWDIQDGSRRHRWDTILDALLKCMMMDGEWPREVKGSVFAGPDAFHVTGDVQRLAMPVIGTKDNGRTKYGAATVYSWEDILWRSCPLKTRGAAVSASGLRWEIESPRRPHSVDSAKQALLRRLQSFVDTEVHENSVVLALDYRNADATYEQLRALGSRTGYHRSFDLSTTKVYILIGGAHGFDGRDDSDGEFFQEVLKVFQRKLNKPPVAAGRVLRVNLCEEDEEEVPKFTAAKVAAFLSVEYSRGQLQHVVTGAQALLKTASRTTHRAPWARTPQAVTSQAVQTEVEVDSLELQPEEVAEVPTVRPQTSKWADEQIDSRSQEPDTSDNSQDASEVRAPEPKQLEPQHPKQGLDKDAQQNKAALPTEEVAAKAAPVEEESRSVPQRKWKWADINDDDDEEEEEESETQEVADEPQQVEKEEVETGTASEQEEEDRKEGSKDEEEVREPSPQQEREEREDREDEEDRGEDRPTEEESAGRSHVESTPAVGAAAEHHMDVEAALPSESLSPAKKDENAKPVPRSLPLRQTVSSSQAPCTPTEEVQSFASTAASPSPPASVAEADHIDSSSIEIEDKDCHSQGAPSEKADEVRSQAHTEGDEANSQPEKRQWAGWSTAPASKSPPADDAGPTLGMAWPSLSAVAVPMKRRHGKAAMQTH